MTTTLWLGESEKLAHNLPDGIGLVATDPPYGVDFRSRRAVTAAGKRWVKSISNDASLSGACELFLDVMDIVLPKTKDECDLYIFTRWDIVDTWIQLVREELVQYGFSYKMMLVWDKGIPGMGDIDANWGCGHELILYCKKGRRDVPYRRSSIIAVDKVHASKLIHPMEKPVDLLRKFIEMSTEKNDLVVDPFAGSAATLVAAQELGRHAIGIEKDPEFHARSSQRLLQGGMDF